jgi:uncharacterized protein
MLRSILNFKNALILALAASISLFTLRAVAADTNPVLMAAFKGDTKTVTKLLKRGVSPNYVGDAGVSPILVAAITSNYAMLTVLIESGADVNHADGEGYTALCLSAQRADIKAIRLLTRQKSVAKSVNHPCGKAKQSALLMVMGLPDPTPAKLLLAAGANPKQTDALSISAKTYCRSVKISTTCALIK